MKMDSAGIRWITPDNLLNSTGMIYEVLHYLPSGFRRIPGMSG